MTAFLTLPPSINIGKYAAITLVDPASFRSDKGDQAPALYLVVGNGISEENGSSTCDLYRIDLFAKIVTKENTQPLPFGLVSGLSYDPLTDELMLIDGNKSHADRIYKIDYTSAAIKSYTYVNYGLSSVVEGISKFPFPRESGFLVLHSNPARPLNRINFFDDNQLLFERRNLFYFTYYLRGSLFYPVNNQNDYSFLLSSQTPGSSNVLTFKTVKSNLVIEGKSSPMTSDLLNDKNIYRAVDNKVYTLDRISLRIKEQTVIDQSDIIALSFWRNSFYTIHENSDIIYKTDINAPNRLTRLITYAEEYRIKPTESTQIVAQVTDEKYSPLSDITITTRILKDQDIDKVTPTCSKSDGAIILQLIPDDLVIRDPFIDPENLQFIEDQFALTLTEGDDLQDGDLSDKMLTFQILDTPDEPLSTPLMVENLFSAIPISSIFDSNSQSLSFWNPRSSTKPLILEFNDIKTIQYLEIVLTKFNNKPFVIKDGNNKVIYSNSDHLGSLHTLRILDFIKTPEITTNKLQIFAEPGTKVYDIQVKISVPENLGIIADSEELSNTQGLAEFLYQAKDQEGIELIKVSAHNKTFSSTKQTKTLLNNELIESELLNVEIAIKEVASSIVINLKNPQTSFSYSTLQLVKPPGPRPADSLSGVIDYPDIPVTANTNIIDSGSYINSITTSNNLIWVLSNGGNASIISTNPTADALDFIITPNQQPLGTKNANITITAQQNFTFNSGTRVDFGPGIIVNSIKLLDTLDDERPRIVVNITISDVTTIGPRDITITSGNNKVPPLKNRFEILPQSIAAISPVNFVADASTSPRFQTIFINSASLTSSITWGPFIYIADNNGYLTRADNSLLINKQKLLEGSIKQIGLGNLNQIIIGTEQGAFYKVENAQDPLEFNPSLSYITSIPKVLIDFAIMENKIIAINKNIKQLDIINIDTFTRITDSHEVSSFNLEKIWNKENRLFVVDEIGTIFEIDPTDFSTILSIQVPNNDKITGVEILDDNLYFSTDHGMMYRFDGSLELYQDFSSEGGIVTMSKYFRTLQLGTEYGRYIAVTID